MKSKYLQIEEFKILDMRDAEQAFEAYRRDLARKHEEEEAVRKSEERAKAMVLKAEFEKLLGELNAAGKVTPITKWIAVEKEILTDERYLKLTKPEIYVGPSPEAIFLSFFRAMEDKFFMDKRKIKDLLKVCLNFYLFNELIIRKRNLKSLLKQHSMNFLLF